MSRGNNAGRRTGKNGARIATVRAEELEDRGGDVRGTTTERYTVAPPVNVVHEETTRRALPPGQTRHHRG